MGLRALAWAGFFCVTLLLALHSPIWGIIGYMGHYCIGAERQWWHAAFNSLGLRYSLSLALATGVGMAVNWHKLRFGKQALTGHEKLLLLFLGIVWLSNFMGERTFGAYTGAGIDHPSIKITKIIIFALMLTHVATDPSKLRRVFSVLVLGALILGIQAWEMPYNAFVKGRLENVGGADFSDSNHFGGYMAGILFVVGAYFVTSANWKAKVFSFLAGGFTANAVILARSRGAFLGLAAGAVVAACLAPKAHRKKVLIGLALGCAGGLYLCDASFLSRIASINDSAEERDRSAANRLEIWAGSTKLVLANPILGVGPGNFYQRIGEYEPKHAGRDAHNTYLRCAGDLGLPGIAVFVLIVVSAFRSLRRVMVEASLLPVESAEPVMWGAYGICTGLVAILVYGSTGTLIYTEYLWWFLAFPVCLERIVENLKADLAADESHFDMWQDKQRDFEYASTGAD